MYQNAVVDERLLVAVVAVQQQTGATECGVMAIANGYHAVCIGYITRWRSLRDLHTEGRRPEVV